MNITEFTVAQMCEMVKTFGHMTTDPIGSTLYILCIKIGVGVPGWGGQVDHDDIETNVRKWLLNNKFTLDKPDGDMRITDSYSLSNRDKDSPGKYLDEENEVLPHDVSLLNVNLPGNEFDRVYGKTRLVKHFVKLDKEYELFEHPKEVKIMLFMKKPERM